MRTFCFVIVEILALIGLSEQKAVPYIGNPIIENCVACKFVWENVKEALTDSTEEFLSQGRRNPILAAQSFQYFCRIAPDIFFEPCNIMFEKLFYMTQDFCARKSIKDICIDNELCVKE